MPKAVLRPFFIPRFFVDMDEATDLTNAYFDTKQQRLYLISSQSDGAGIYIVAFEFEKGKFVKAYLLHEN